MGYFHSVVNDKGEDGNLSADVEGLSQDSFAKMSFAKNASANRTEWSVRFFLLKGRHFGEGEEEKKPDNDNANGDVGFFHEAHVGLLDLREFIRSIGSHRSEAVDDAAIKFAENVFIVGNPVLVECDEVAVLEPHLVLVVIDECGAFGKFVLILNEVSDFFRLMVFDSGAEFSNQESGGNEFRHDGAADNGAHGIEGLGQVESLGGGLRRAHGEDVGIAGCFQKGEPEGQDVETQNKDVEVEANAGGNAEEGADGIKDEADHDCGFVGILSDEDGGRKGHGEVAAIKGKLDEGGLGVIDKEDFLEDFHEGVGDVIGEAPEGEATGCQDKGGEILFRNDFRFCWVLTHLLVFCWRSLCAEQASKMSLHPGIVEGKIRVVPMI